MICGNLRSSADLESVSQKRDPFVIIGAVASTRISPDITNMRNKIKME